MPPTLLLADDSLTIQRIVSLTFADQPVRVVVAKDGQDAINRMSNERPDLVLADTNMPCVDGYELARWVRQQPHLSAVPVLLLAGATDPVDEQRLHDSGANGVLEKPFEPSHVISRVKELLGIKGAPPAAPTRLVTAPDAKPTPSPARPVSAARPAGGAGDRVEPPTAAPVAAELRPGGRPDSGVRPARPRPSPMPNDGPPALPAGSRAEEREGTEILGGDPEDWLLDDDAASSPSGSLADELGVGGTRFYGQDADVPSARGLDVDSSPERGHRPGLGDSPAAVPASNPADVFESLLAAEEDPRRTVLVRSAAPEMTAEHLDRLASLVVERLRPGALRDELQRGLTLGLREAVAQTVRESVSTETRAAVAEAVQAAVNGTILGTVRGAVTEAVASAVPAAVEQQLAPRVEQAVRHSIEPVIAERLGGALADLVRETVSREMRELGPAIQRAVVDAIAGEAGGRVQEIVHDTAERLVREEIAKIRERRG